MPRVRNTSSSVYWMGGNKTRRNLNASLIPEDEEDETDDGLNINVINNRIYFYEDINTTTVLCLCKHLLKLENQMKRMQDEYNLKEPPCIYLHINSHGGDAFAGLSAMNAIENTKVPVVCIVDGFVASAATFLLMGATGGRQMRKNSTILIHQLRTEFWGKYDELQDEMRNSENIMKNIKRIYKQKSEMPLEKIDTILKKELHLTHKKCLKYGLVTEII